MDGWMDTWMGYPELPASPAPPTGDQAEHQSIFSECLFLEEKKQIFTPLKLSSAIPKGIFS